MATLPLNEAVERFGENEERADKWVNDPVGYDIRTGGTQESIPAMMDRLEGEINAEATTTIGAAVAGAVASAQASADAAADAAADSALASQDAAEEAADSALAAAVAAQASQDAAEEADENAAEATVSANNAEAQAVAAAASAASAAPTAASAATALAGVYAASSEASAQMSANAAGISGIYGTYALANAAVGSIGANAFVIVTQDENYSNQASYYQKVSGVLTYRGAAGLSRKLALGAHQFVAYNRGSVVCHVGDSNTVARTAYRSAYEPGWLGVGGVFEGWTSYNLGINGSTANTWVGLIATADQNEAPADYVAGGPRGGTPWQVVNAVPEVIIVSLGTNDFRVGAGPANLAAKTVAFRNDMATLLNFFMSRTSASIVLRLPQPIVFANPDPDGYTDCVDANDAAARSAAMRSVYLEWINASDRIKLVDLHKHLFGYRIDSLAASLDPETNGAMMSDTLHPNGLGYARQVQVIAKTLNPNLPYTTKANLVPVAVTKVCYWAKTIAVVGSLANAFQIATDPQSKSAAVTPFADRTATDPASPARKPLNNIPYINEAGFFGSLSDIREIGGLGSFYIYFHDTATTFGPLTIVSVTDFPLNGYTQVITSTAAFGGRTGPATIYCLAPKDAPHFQAFIQPITIDMNGAQPLTVGAVGLVPQKFPSNSISLNITGVRGIREGSSGIATVDIFKGATAAGDWPSPYTPYPGLRLGTLSWPNQFRIVPTWTVDATNFPGGVASFGGGTTHLVAQCISGTLGKACAITLDISA